MGSYGIGWDVDILYLEDTVDADVVVIVRKQSSPATTRTCLQCLVPDEFRAVADYNLNYAWILEVAAGMRRKDS